MIAGTRSLLVLACISFMISLGFAAASFAAERGFGAWIAACDNTHRCTLLATQEQGYVLLIRDADKPDVRILGAMNSDIADVNTRDIELSIGQPALTLRLEHAETHSGVVRGESADGVAFASALTAAPLGKGFVLRSGDAGELDFAADGFGDAWSWIAEQQQSPAPAPVLTVTKARQKPLPKKPPNAVAKDWQAVCKADGVEKGDWGLLRVADQTTVWRLSCGGRQRLYAYDERTRKTRLLQLPYPQPAGHVLALDRFDATVSLSPGALGVTAYHLTDCRNARGQFGFIGRWRWTGSGFDLESFNRFADEAIGGYGGKGCVPHEDWPSIYRTAVP
jgi:hypothetical protein